MVAMRITATAVLTIVTVLLASLPAANARHDHGGFGHGGSGHGGFGLHGTMGAHTSMGGADFAGDRQHANDSYVNAASAEGDKLLDTRIKSICTGC